MKSAGEGIGALTKLPKGSRKQESYMCGRFLAFISKLPKGSRKSYDLFGIAFNYEKHLKLPKGSRKLSAISCCRKYHFLSLDETPKRE